MIRMMKGDEKMELPRPEIAGRKVQAKEALWRMLGCCVLFIAIFKALWQLL